MLKRVVFATFVAFVSALSVVFVAVFCCSFWIGDETVVASINRRVPMGFGPGTAASDFGVTNTAGFAS